MDLRIVVRYGLGSGGGHTKRIQCQTGPGHLLGSRREGIDAPISRDTRSGGLDDLLASAEIGHDALVDLASEETFQAPDDLSLGSAVRRAT